MMAQRRERVRGGRLAMWRSDRSQRRLADRAAIKLEAEILA